ncbi:MAG: flagellar type III secretion system pore protein FliP [Methylococcales bacterium]|nr:flagellar type III secretion system pore protein FliP [Methylococcales bacterium]
MMILGVGLAAPALVSAQTGLEALTVTTAENGQQTYSVTLQILVLMTLLTLLPALLLSMTSFARIVIVLSLLRQALGTAQAPSNQILLGLSLFLTMFIMAPVFEQIKTEALNPYLEEKVNFMDALDKASVPIKTFMLRQTRTSDLEMFIRVSGQTVPESEQDIGLSVLMPAYLTSELKTAFQIGFMMFLPFLIIDLVIASVLMSMGMMMLSPMIVSLPFKLMLFVLADGWSLIMEMLAASFYLVG